MKIILYYLSGIFFFLFSLLMFFFSVLFIYLNNVIFMEWNLISLNSFMLNMLIYLDWISLMFMFTVMFISSMILFYCVEYMNHDLNKIRFFYLVLIFVFSMFLMILSPNLISIILGWDGLGLVSYCLVIYYQSYFSFNSGMLTILMNRIGDILMMISISFFFIWGSWNFVMMDYFTFFLLILILFCSFTKSAQIPFSSWLPAAMAAPTPVSSLVHSSTLVTAGVYLLIRFHYILYKNNNLMIFLLMIGMCTMFMAGISANFEFDMKKIIAYSTLSQLGLMMVVFSMKFYLLCYFHLIVHAMFKSMMFMCSGVLIHMMLNYQDIRFLGNLMKFFPFTMSMFLVSNLSLCGMPFFSGFFSKDLILEKIFMSNFSIMGMYMILISTMLTVIYSIRMMYYLMFKNLNFLTFFSSMDNKIMNYSMYMLMINSIMFGEIIYWMIFMNIDYIFLMKLEKMMILFICFLSIFMGILVFKYKFVKINFFFYFFSKLMFLYNLNFFVTLNMMKLMKKYYFVYDKGLMSFMFENLFIELLKYLNFKIYMNNLLTTLMMLMSFMIFYMFFI